MIRIRTIDNFALPASQNRITQVKHIFTQNFPDLAQYAEKIHDMLMYPFKYGYQTTLLVSETSLNRVTGFALILHFHEANCSFLDFIAVRKEIHGGGLGGALYEAAREYCCTIASSGLYMEVQPDDPNLTQNSEELAQGRKRLRFYESYGVRPVIGTEYHAPVGTPPTTAYLLFDPLDRTTPLSNAEARSGVRCILKRRFSNVVTPESLERIVESFRDDPVRFRPPRYIRTVEQPKTVASGRLEKPFVLIASAKHALHHVKSRGYLERPARVGVILDALLPLNIFTVLPVRRFSEKAILAVHDPRFVSYLKTVCTKLQVATPVYPDTFPIRRSDRRPKKLSVQAGYYCIDSCTPLDRNAYDAARSSVDVAMTSAEEVLQGCRVAYALCRPPGHHAEKRVFGGFCYFNNAAIAANYLTAYGKVALLDIDFHHGNGTQDIFYERSDVLTLSIHGHPDYSYPYFSGFADETGTGPGLGFNYNFPLPPNTEEAAYLRAFQKALQHITRFRPDFLVISLGMDILKNDPTGTFVLSVAVFQTIAGLIMQLATPILVVQEGGYNLQNLKRAAPALFTAMANAQKNS